MVPANQEAKESQSPKTTTPSTATTNETNNEEEPKVETVEASGDKPDEEKKKEIKGDPEAAVVYLRRLLPTFASLYQATMLVSVR